MPTDKRMTLGEALGFPPLRDTMLPARAAEGNDVRRASTFGELVKRKYGSDNWVLARRTARIVRRYGDDVVALSKKQYRILEDQLEWESAPNHPAAGLITKLVADQCPAADFIRELRAAGYRIEKVFEGGRHGKV